MCTSCPPHPNPEWAWREIERAVVAAQLDERTPRESLEAMCKVVREQFGVPSEVLSDAGSPEIHTHGVLFERGGERVAVRWTGNALDDATNRRLERLFGLVGACFGRHTGDSEMRTIDVHRLRNHVAGIHANVELAKLLVDSESPTSQRDQIVKALEHALMNCRAMLQDTDAQKK